jgi:hypothetical protein
MKYITTKDVLKCCHGGTVKVAQGMTRVYLDGGEVLAREALVGAPIVGCPNGPAPGLVPCTAVVSVLLGASLGARANGLTPLLENATGLTNGSPPGLWRVDSAQARASEALAGPPGPARVEGGRQAQPVAPPQREQPGFRDLAWQPQQARVGDPVTLEGGFTEAGAAFLVPVTIYEDLGERAARVVTALDGKVSNRRLRAEWVVLYPAFDPAAAAGPADAECARLFFEVRHKGRTYRSARDDGRMLRVTADLRCRLTDPDGHPLARETCYVRAAFARASVSCTTDEHGCFEARNLHPAPATVFVPGKAVQLAADAAEAGAAPAAEPSAVDHALGVVRLCLGRLSQAGLPVLAPLAASLQELEAALVEAAEAGAEPAPAAAVTGIVIAVPASLVLLLILGVALFVALQQLLQHPWPRPRLRRAADGAKKQSEPAPAPAPSPDPEKLPRVPPIIWPLGEGTRERETERRVRLSWPAYYLPPPPGWSAGAVAHRAAPGGAAGRRRKCPSQDKLNQVIHAACEFAQKRGVAVGDVLRDPRSLAAYLEMTGRERLKPLAGVTVAWTGCAFSRRGSMDFHAGGGLYLPYHAHHLLPLYFEGGDDAPANLCVIDADCHLHGHVLLRYQDHWTAEGLPRDLLRHPPGLTYEVHFHPGPDPRNPWDEDVPTDPEEPDYMPWLEER